MKIDSRTQNAKANIIVGYISQIGTAIISFIGRKIFLLYLSADYLGVNGLFSNILTVLSFAELGLDSALVYSLYKPVANNDTNLVYSLLKYYKKVYRLLATVIFIVGVAIIPLFKYIINSDLENNQLIIYYLLILSNTVLSYFVADKAAVLSAFQKQRVQKAVTLLSNLIMQILHIIVLVIWRNYYLYLASTILSTIIGAVLLSFAFRRHIPREYQNASIVEFEKRPIIDRVASTFCYKIGAVLVSNTDNILISMLVSTLAVGLYSNYYTVTTLAQSFIAIMTTSLMNGIGNFAAKEKKSDQKQLFDMLLLAYHFIATLGLCGFYNCLDDFIIFWIGNEFVLDKQIVLIISINFYQTNILNPVYIFREANGLFSQTKYTMIIRALFNLILSYVLGIKYGIFGIFLATALSLLFTSFWYEPRLLCKYVFNSSVRVYYAQIIKHFATCCLSFATCCLICIFLHGGISVFLLKVILIMAVNTVLFSVFNFKSRAFRALLRHLHM